MSADVSFGEIFSHIDGKSHKGTSPRTFPSIDPATTEVIATIHESSRADVDTAVEAASKAFSSWSRTSPAARARILSKAVRILRERNHELALIETHDTGKALSETSTVDVTSGADVLEYYANLVGGGGLIGETTHDVGESSWIYTRKEPLGVCAGIGAWNYPIQIALWKSAPCLAAGNTMVYKPSEVTPLHADRLAQIYAEAGLPPGVFNVVYGDGKPVGESLVDHPRIAKVSFTGQPSTGSAVASAASKGMKYVTMELGGKSPCLILPDIDVETAVDGAMMANFFSTGQVCTNGTRVFVPDSMLPQFEQRLVEKMQYVRMGPPLDPDANFGPLVSEAHLKKVSDYIVHGRHTDCAKVLYDGALAHQNLDTTVKGTYAAKGYWCPPMVFTNCTDIMKIVQEEIFGPVMCILPYSTEGSKLQASPSDPTQEPSWLQDLISRANDTPLGLAAGVFTRDLALAHKVIGRLEAGITWINTWGDSPAEMSVGGWKRSGVGVENGRQGIEAYTQNKSTFVEMGGSVATAFTPKL
ncbi:MAG: hypothetical protein M1831_000418 [Alyxoria varia]|nr:MAG: hypothetical protein M1831_000418 [Alyxoria varia]